MLPRAPDLPRHDEPRLLQHAQVLHDAEAGHLELRLQLAERPSAALEQPVEEQQSGRVRERLEHTVLVVLHGARIRDRVVTCQEGTTAWHPPATTPRKGVQACFQTNGRASSASSTSSRSSRQSRRWRSSSRCSTTPPATSRPPGRTTGSCLRRCWSCCSSSRTSAPPSSSSPSSGGRAKSLRWGM